MQRLAVIEEAVEAGWCRVEMDNVGFGGEGASPVGGGATVKPGETARAFDGGESGVQRGEGFVPGGGQDGLADTSQERLVENDERSHAEIIEGGDLCRGEFAEQAPERCERGRLGHAGA